MIGFVPVARRAWSVSGSYRREADWRYKVGLSFDKKVKFDPSIPIEQLVGICRVLDGKTGRQLHDSFRMAPILSFEECLLLLEIAAPVYKISKFSKELTQAENSDWNDDLSNSLKGRNVPLERVKQALSVFKRNQRLIKALKKEYDGICQICGIDNLIETDSGEFYTEGHHLIPLGEAGSDDLGNVVILCLLCHKKLHYSRDRNLIKEMILYSDRHRRIIERFRRE